MVAGRVEVYSRSASPGSPGYQWLSDGSRVCEIAEASGVRTGTKIIIHLKSDCREFASEAQVRDVVTKYSNFVSFPLYLNGRRMNTLQAIWMMDPKDIGEWQHEEFYRYIAQAYEKPCYTLHYKMVAPLNNRSIFNVPDTKPSAFDVSRELGSGVALYSLKVLIQTKATDILPKWLCFIRGVVDSEDISLSLSWELLQESALIRKLQDVLQQRLIKFLVDQSKKDAEKYAKFFEDYGLFMREGIVTTAEQEVKEDIAKLLCYYRKTQRFSSAMSSDELTLLHLREFDKKKLISVETDIIVDHYKEWKFKDGSPAAERLSEKETEDLMMGAARHFCTCSSWPRPRRSEHSSCSRCWRSTPGILAWPRLVDQIYENAVIAAGLVDDPRAVVGCLNELLVQALEPH
uniref:Uncharacterized protein n=1 Tax=Cebus imitator TaxID=2715852 RepID=A0A2K5R2R9_CEBIM